MVGARHAQTALRDELVMHAGEDRRLGKAHLKIQMGGMAAAIDVGNPDGKPGQRPWQISMECWKRGLYLRYSGDNVQLGPPFISEKSEIDTMCNILADVIPSVE